MPLLDNAWYVQGSTGVTVNDLGSQSTAGGTATVTITSVAVPAGALIVVVASEVTAASTGSCADGTNGAYSSAVSGAMSGAAGFGAVFYFANSAALTAATITFTKQASAHAGSISAFYVTGIATSTPVDATTTTSTAVNSATPTVTSGTPTQAGELIVGACAYTNASARTLTNTGSFVTPFATNTGQPTASCGGGHLNVNGTLAVVYNPTLAAACDNRLMVVGFKLATTTLIGWWNVTQWAASTSKVTGNMVRQNATPNLNAERVFVCIASTGGTGQTAGSEPAWTTTAQCTRGAKFTDNTVTWQEATGIAALNGDLTNTPTWTTVKNTAIVLGQVIQNVAGTLILICTTAGTAGNGAEPSWAAFTNAGATTADNTVTWTTLGASFSNWAAPHARMQNAFASTWGQVGNAFYFGSTHYEIQQSLLQVTVSAGTSANPFFCYSVDSTTAVPPTTLLAGATVNCMPNRIILCNLIGSGQYYNGFTFISGAAGVFGVMGAITQAFLSLENCTLKSFSQFDVGGGSAAAGANSGKIRFKNTTVETSNIANGIRVGTSDFVWTNTPSAIQGTPPTALFNAGGDATGPPNNTLMVGVDFSAMGAGKTLVATAANGFRYTFVDCKLGASVTPAATPGQRGTWADFIRCDSGATNYRHERYWYEGTQTVETTIVRTGGASDGTTPISWKLVSTANSKWIVPFESQPISIWNDTTGSHQVTIYGTTTGGGVPNNDDIWIEVEYLGDASTPQGSFATTTKANNLAASVTTNNSSDASTWGGGGAGNGFKMVTPSFTVNQKGALSVVVKVAKVSATYYIDPFIVVS